MDPSAFMMVVAPDGKFYLINNNTRKVFWSYTIEDRNDNKIYAASRVDDVSNYIDAIVDDCGSIRLCHFQHLSPEWIEWRSDSEMRDYVKFYLGEDVVVRSQEMSVDLSESGECVSEEDMTSFFRIRKTRYKILTNEWQLRFSKYQSFFYSDSHSIYPYPVHVYHTHVVKVFEKLCSKLCPEDLKYEVWIEKMKSDETVEIRDHIGAKDDNLFRGLFGGLFDVVVKSYPKSHVFSSACRKLWESNGSDYIVRFYGAKVNRDFYHLCFEYCPFTLRAYVDSEVNELNQPKPLLGVFRGLFRGLKYLHKQKICHENLNPWNILLTNDDKPKFSGFRHLQTYTSQLEVVELRSLGKLVIFCCSSQHDLSKENYAQRVMHPNQMFPWAYEAKEIARRLQDLSLVPSLTEVGFHPWLWDIERRIQFIQDASEFLDTAPYLDGYQRMQNIQSSLFMNKDWSTKIPPNIIAEMNKHGTYDYDKPRHLLRFIRNIIYHLPEVLNSRTMQKADCEFLGPDKLTVEMKFRDLFPELLIKIYTLLRDDIPRIDRVSLRLYYDR